MRDGFLRVASATPRIKVADCEKNADEIISQAREAAEKGASMIVFPELCITGYTCSDLFLQNSLISAAEKALGRIIEETTDLDAVILVGLPVAARGALYNCAAVICKGKLLGCPAKKYVPNYSEFYELRHFTPAEDTKLTELLGETVNCGNKQLFQCVDMPFYFAGIDVRALAGSIVLRVCHAIVVHGCNLPGNYKNWHITRRLRALTIMGVIGCLFQQPLTPRKHRSHGSTLAQLRRAPSSH